MADRPIRPCMECGQADTAPRHRINDKRLPGGHILKHLDCCRDAGCPEGTCGPQLELAGGAKNDELVARLAELRAAQNKEG